MNVILTAIGGVIATALLYTALVAWPTMLLFGAVHSFLPVIPAFSFWQTVGILLLVGFLFPRSSSSAQ